MNKEARFSAPSGTFSLWCHPKFEDRCHSVVEFIERAIMHSKNGKFLYFLRSRVPGESCCPHAARASSRVCEQAPVRACVDAQFPANAEPSGMSWCARAGALPKVPVC